MTNKMATKPIPGLILGMSIPVIFSMLIQALYNVVDSIYVSRVGEDALASVSLAFPIQMIVVAAFVGLQTGISSSVSRKLGAKDKTGASIAGEHGILISFGLYALIVIISFFVKDSFFGQFTGNLNIIQGATTYTSIVLLFSFGIITSHSVTGMMQGSGDMVKPMIAQLIGAVTNLILDPIFIFGWLGLPAMGVKGAAIATVTGQILASIYAWSMLFSGHCQLHINLKAFKFDPHTVKDILLVGVPSAIMQGLGSIMLGVMNLILSRFGDAAIAIMGVYFRVQSMAFMPIFGLAIGTLPVVGFNFGARNKDRMSHAIRFSITVAMSFMGFCFLIFQFFPRALMGMFKPTEDMLAIGIPAFRTISFIFLTVGITIILSTAFQAFGKAYFSLLLSVIRQIVILLPAAAYLATFGNVDYVWFAFIIAEIVGVISAVILFYRTYHHATKEWILE